MLYWAKVKAVAAMAAGVLFAVSMTGVAAYKGLAEDKTAPNPAPTAVPADGTVPDLWSAPQQGIAVRLKPTNEEMPENGQPNTDVKSRLEFALLVKNVSDKPVTIQKGRGKLAHELQWEIKDANGGSWAPSFLPPPMPMPPGTPEPPAQTQELQAGEEFVYDRINGISGFRKAGEKDGAWYQVPLAGTYTIIARKIRVGAIEGEFASPPVVLLVRPADDAVNGLRLTLETDATLASADADGKAVKKVNLRLTFRNVGDKPIKLDTYDIVWSRLQFDVRGGMVTRARVTVERAMRAPQPEDYRRIDPGQEFVRPHAIPFPGEVGETVYGLKPGGEPYRIRVKYMVPEKQDPRSPLEAGRWTGTVTSNEIQLWVGEAAPKGTGTGKVDDQEMRRKRMLEEELKRRQEQQPPATF